MKQLLNQFLELWLTCVLTLCSSFFGGLLSICFVFFLVAFASSEIVIGLLNVVEVLIIEVKVIDRSMLIVMVLNFFEGCSLRIALIKWPSDWRTWRAKDPVVGEEVVEVGLQCVIAHHSEDILDVRRHVFRWLIHQVLAFFGFYSLLWRSFSGWRDWFVILIVFGPFLLGRLDTDIVVQEIECKERVWHVLLIWQLLLWFYHFLFLDDFFVCLALQVFLGGFFLHIVIDDGGTILFHLAKGKLLFTAAWTWALQVAEPTLFVVLVSTLDYLVALALHLLLQKCSCSRFDQLCLCRSCILSHDIVLFCNLNLILGLRLALWLCFLANLGRITLLIYLIYDVLLENWFYLL